MINVLFYLAAAVATVSTLLVITRRNAVHALLYLIVSLLAVAVIFFLIGAPFVAALEVIIYAGAIMVLFIFVVMMFNLESVRPKAPSLWAALRPWVGPALLSLVLLAELVLVLAARSVHPLQARWIPPREVGLSLFTTYVLAVELASMLLLAAVVGAYHIGRRLKSGGEAEGGGGRP
jgi:NADH-quinone oxidoreductase subunit J